MDKKLTQSQLNQLNKNNRQLSQKIFIYGNIQVLINKTYQMLEQYKTQKLKTYKEIENLKKLQQKTLQKLTNKYGQFIDIEQDGSLKF